MSETQEEYTLFVVVLGWEHGMTMYFKIGTRSGRWAPQDAMKRVGEYASTMPETQGLILTSSLSLNLEVPAPPETVNTPIPLFRVT